MILQNEQPLAFKLVVFCLVMNPSTDKFITLQIVT